MTKAIPPAQAVDRWPLDDAKAKFSALVRAAETKGPQYVTVQGQDAVVMLAADAFLRLVPERTGRALIDAMRACPVSDFEFGSPPVFSPIRDVDL